MAMTKAGNKPEFELTKTSHISPKWVGYGLSIVSTGLILGLRPASERRRYIVTSLIGWVQA